MIDIQVTEQGRNSPLEVLYYFMPLYGPQEWFEFKPGIWISQSAAPQLPEEKK